MAGEWAVVAVATIGTLGTIVTSAGLVLSSRAKARTDEIEAAKRDLPRCRRERDAALEYVYELRKRMREAGVPSPPMPPELDNPT